MLLGFLDSIARWRKNANRVNEVARGYPRAFNLFDGVRRDSYFGSLPNPHWKITAT